MWRFQLQALSEKRSFLLQLIAVSALLHTIFLLIVFLSKSASSSDIIKFNKSVVQVRFVPTLDVKKIAQSQTLIHKKKGSVKKGAPSKNLPSSLKNGITAVQSSSVTQVLGSTRIHAGSKKKLPHKSSSAVSKQSEVLSKKTLARKASQEKVIKKRESLPAKTKDAKNTSSSYNFMPEYNQKFFITNLVKNTLHKPHLPEPQLRIPITEVLTPVSTVPSDIEVTTKNVQQSVQPAQEIQEEVIYVLPREYNALMSQQELYHALQTAWNPPPGIKDTVSAQVTIKIDKKGEVVDMVFKKSSGVMLFDASIQHALERLVLPESLCSKTLTITFSP